MRIVCISDAWHPQVNGVVRTLTRVRDEVTALGHRMEVIGPDRFRTLPCPTYPEIRLAILPKRRLKHAILDNPPNALHIATEGPLGIAARAIAMKAGLPFTTSFHTRFPEYVSARLPVPVSWGYAVMRWFHGPSAGVMVATPSLRRELAARGLGNIKTWSRGVDTDLFRPHADPAIDLPKPVFAYVGRVAVEKNLPAFLSLDLPGTKLVVGDGPARADLEARFPAAVFVGAKFGEDLARHYAAADVFVFPSLTDTFGLVVLEALACGVPVAAFPVTGPRDTIEGSGCGAVDDDLRAAALAALSVSSEQCRAHALKYSWRACAEQFLANLASVGTMSAPRAAVA